MPACVGVPESTPPAKDTPVGRDPDSVIVGAGKPVAVGVKLEGLPWMKVAEVGEVMDGGASTGNEVTAASVTAVANDCADTESQPPRWNFQ